MKGGDDREAVRKMPWNVIVMVCGVTVLIAVLEKAEGIDLIVSQIARFATPSLATAEVAFLTGLVSVYSSTSGVVLPAFLPMVPGLATQIGVAPFALATSMNVGGHLVDVSPLSTIGALCIAAAPGRRRHPRAVQQAAGLGTGDVRSSARSSAGRCSRGQSMTRHRIC